MMTVIPKTIDEAAAILRKGGVVAFPTETVYGLGADATNEIAIRKVFQLKERPYDHPLIVHIAHIAQLQDWAENVSPEAMSLAKAFWPGPLTIVLKKQSHVLGVVTGGQDTVALRIPHHPIAEALLNAFGGGIVAPSANKFTHISPTTAAAVYEELDGRVDLVLDGGACEVGLESTIIDMSNDTPVILRPGKIHAAMIEKVIGRQVRYSTEHVSSTRAPGMHHVHYAPTTRTTLVEPNLIPAYLETLRTTDLPIGLVMYTHFDLFQTNHPAVYYVKMPDDPAAYAHELYRTLRALDNQHYKRIVVEMVPSGIEWDAIRDRLLKASAK